MARITQEFDNLITAQYPLTLGYDAKYEEKEKLKSLQARKEEVLLKEQEELGKQLNEQEANRGELNQRLKEVRELQARPEAQKG